jgi:hypothetical protein
MRHYTDEAQKAETVPSVFIYIYNIYNIYIQWFPWHPNINSPYLKVGLIKHSAKLYFKTSIVTVNNSQGEMFVFKAFSGNLGKKLMKHL